MLGLAALQALPLGSTAVGVISPHAVDLRAESQPPLETRDSEERLLDLDPRRSKLLRTTKPVSRISITNPAVVEIVQFSPTEFELIGGTTGQTAVIATVVVLFVLAYVLLALVNATLSGIYSAALYRFAMGRLDGDRELTADIVQTTICKAIDRLTTFRGEAALMTWLCACCRNEIAGHFRKKMRPIREVDLETVKATPQPDGDWPNYTYPTPGEVSQFRRLGLKF